MLWSFHAGGCEKEEVKAFSFTQCQHISPGLSGTGSVVSNMIVIFSRHCPGRDSAQKINGWVTFVS
jgi:hypothetical protein